MENFIKSKINIALIDDLVFFKAANLNLSRRL